MTETKHTPGPWKTRKGFFSDAVEIYKPKHLMKPFIPTEIAIIRSEGPEGEANARLISAAPELLEALQAFVKYADDVNDDSPEFDRASAAIAKAVREAKE